MGGLNFIYISLQHARMKMLSNLASSKGVFWVVSKLDNGQTNTHTRPMGALSINSLPSAAGPNLKWGVQKLPHLLNTVTTKLTLLQN